MEEKEDVNKNEEDKTNPVIAEDKDKDIPIVKEEDNIDNELQSDCTKLENGATDEICSKLSVSKDKINTHVCIKDTPKLNMALCEKFIKKKYGLSDKKELITVQGDREGFPGLRHLEGHGRREGTPLGGRLPRLVLQRPDRRGLQGSRGLHEGVRGDALRGSVP